MKKRMLLALGASFTLAASAPVAFSTPQDATAAAQTLLARAEANCRVPQDPARLAAVFATQQPGALRTLAARRMTVCLDDRLQPLETAGSNRMLATYGRYFDSFELPATGNYAARPHLFNALADKSRTTLLERAGHILSHFGQQNEHINDDEMRRAGAAAQLRGVPADSPQRLGVLIMNGQPRS